MIWAIALHGIWVLLKGIHFIYLLEKKQYRLHRFQSMIHDQGFFMLFYELQFRLPSKSLRALLLVGFHILATSVLFLYSFENIYLYDFLKYAIFLAPFIAFAIVVTGVVITAVPATLYQQAIMQLAAWKVKSSKTHFIAVTGSYGKSDVVHYLTSILSTTFSVTSTDEDMNTEMGIARSILRNLTPETNFMIIEAATYATGQITRETSYIPFKSAVLTGIGNQHIDLFRSNEALIQEETSVIRRLTNGSQAYVHESHPNIHDLRSQTVALIITYGFSPQNNAVCRDYNVTTSGSSGRISYKGVTVPVRTSTLGKHALQNMIPAICCALDCGIKPHIIKQSIEKMTRRENRLSITRGRDQALLLIDEVNPSVESCQNAIDLLRRYPNKNRMLVVSSLTELGGERGEAYKRIITASRQSNITLMLFRPGHGIHTQKPDVFIFNDVSNLQKSLISKLNKGTVVIMEGMFPQSITQSLMMS